MSLFINKKSVRNIFLNATFFVVLALLFISPTLTYAATGDVTAVRITDEGWYAEIDIEGFVAGGTASYGIVDDGNVGTVDNDPVNAKVIFTVTSQGYNTSGTLGTITRTIYGTKTLRKPYPHNTDADRTVLDETESGGTLTLKVALSDFIYGDDESGSGKSGTDVVVSIPSGWYRDTGAGGGSTYNSAATNFSVTNNSTLPYPKVIGAWAWPGYEKVTSDFLVEAVAFHRFAQNSKPIAAIAFQATDQSSNSVYSTTTEMTVTSRSGDANPVLVYAATMDIDALDQAEVIDVNFTAYPWVGDESSVLNSRVGLGGFTQPEERLGPLHLLNDKSSTYGVGYAYVSPSTGVDATGTVYSTQVAAEAGNAYLTIGGAAAALKTYNNTNHGRNSAGGGVILLAEGNHAYPGTVPSADLGTTMETWMIVKPASTAAKANTKISSGSTSAIKATRIKFEGLTFSPSVSSGGGLTGRTATDAVWLHDNTINATSTNPMNAWKAAYGTQNSITTMTGGFEAIGSAKGPFALVRGNTSASIVTAQFYNILGNKNVTPDTILGVSQQVSLGQSSTTNAIYAFNTVYSMTAAISVANTSTSTSIAIIQNLFESISTNGFSLLDVSAGNGNGATTTNFLFWHNTMIGERNQWGYNSEGTARVPKLNWGSKFNIFTEQGQKSDWFDSSSGTPTPSGNRTGNWPLTYGVGNMGNKSLLTSFAGDFHGLFAQWGATSGTPVSPGFTSDRAAQTGNASGNGTYTLLATSTSVDAATTTSSLYHVLPYDLLGNARYGGPDSGAYEYQPPYTMGTDEIATSSVVRMYGDEKWRAKSATTTDGTADLSITLPGTDRTEWLDISISTWENSGTRHKIWTETSSTTGLTNTVHIVGDLDPSTEYVVSVDDVVGQNITGASCTSGVCTSNSSGEITFTYAGSYSSHEFDVEEQDDPTAPVRSAGSPSGEQSVGTTEVTISLTTDEVSTCKYSTTANTAYASIASTFTTTGGTTHSETISGLTNGTSYNYYVRCIDGALNTNSTDYTISFSVAAAVAQISSNSSSGGSGSVVSKASVLFTRNLQEGMNGEDILLLQKLLNSKGFIVSISGPGSIGRETNVFGPATKNALIRYQTANNIFPAIGYFGPLTRASVNGTTVHNTSISTSTSVIKVVFVRDLEFGSIGTDVKALQMFLNSKGFTVATVGVGSQGNESSYFGRATRAALTRFQVAHGISPAIGYFGPITKKKVNSLIQ